MLYTFLLRMRKPASTSLEWRKPEWVPTVLDPKNAEQKTVHSQHQPAPDYNGNLLSLGVSHPWNFQCQRYGSEGQHSVCQELAVVLMDI